MKLILYNLATAKEPWSEAVSDLYQKKISHFISFEIIHLKPKKTARDDAEFKKNEESKILLQNLTADDYVILFDERGQSLDSLKFAKKIESSLASSKKRLVFVIGGAFGVNEDVQKRAQLQISLSPLVLNHLMAQAVALEQIYRALTIINRIPYHNI